MIISFKSKGLKELFERSHTSKIHKEEKGVRSLLFKEEKGVRSLLLHSHFYFKARKELKGHKRKKGVRSLLLHSYLYSN